MNPLANAGITRDASSVPGLGKFPGVENYHVLLYSCLENSIDRGAWQATVHGVTKSWTRLSIRTEHTLIKCFWFAVNSSLFNLVKTILTYSCYGFKSFLENTMQSVSKCTVVCRNSYCALVQMNCGVRWSGKPLWNTGVTLLKNPKELMRATVKT